MRDYLYSLKKDDISPVLRAMGKAVLCFVGLQEVIFGRSHLQEE